MRWDLVSSLIQQIVNQTKDLLKIVEEGNGKITAKKTVKSVTSPEDKLHLRF